jgi:hypothetical protein
LSRSPDQTFTADGSASHGRNALVAEDVLLLLFKPDSKTIAGENILFYVLGGAVLTDLALTDRILVEDAGLRGTLIHSAGDAAPSDDILKSPWEYIGKKPRNAQTVLAAIGPNLRAPLLDRLVERGHLQRQTGKVLGIFKTETYAEGHTGRRADILAQVRAALVDGEEPTPHIAATTALIYASGALPTFHKEIPWTSPVIARAKELGRGVEGAEAASEAVTRTMTAIVTNAMIAANVLPRI